MRLNDPLTTSVFFEDNTYPLDLSFNKVLDVLEILERKDIFKRDKLTMIMNLLIGKNQLSFQKQAQLWEIIRDNYINLGGKSQIQYDLQGNPLPSEVTEELKVFDLEADAKYIYASFRQIGINLFEQQGKMKWEEFQALLESLPEDTIMQKIIQIRLWKPQKGESAKYKESMRKAQRRYHLPMTGGESDE